MAALPRSWTRRFFEWSGLGTVRVGLAIASLLALVFLAQEAVLGRLSSELFGDIWITVTHIVIVSYLLPAFVYCEQSRDRTIEKVRPLLDPARADEILESATRDRVTLAIAGGIGVVLAFVSSFYIAPGPASYDVATWNPENGWHRVLAPIAGLLAARLSALMLLEAGRLSELARTLREVDLLDPGALGPFSRQALTNALLGIGMVAVFALFIVDDIGYWALVVSMVVATGAVGGLGLLLPLRGVRDRVHEAKDEELAWCRERMRLARERLGEEGNGERGRLEELVAWEARVEAVSEWTLDASAFTRFALYLLIPLGSWAGGAIVERVVDSLLD